MLCRNGKEGWRVYPGVGGVLLLPLLLTVHVCSVCKGEGGEIGEPCAYYFTLLGLYVGFL